MCLNEVGHPLHFLIGNKRALHAHGLAGAIGIKEHIATAKQFFSAAHVQYNARVHLRGHHKRNTRGDVGLDHAGDNINARALRGDNQMHARRARHLRQAADGIFHLAGGGHHKICQLVHHDDDIGQLLTALFFHHLVIAANIACTLGRKKVIAAEHLLNHAVERSGGVFGFGNHRYHQLRYAVVNLQFHHLRVNHNQADLIGRGVIQQAYDQ